MIENLLIAHAIIIKHIIRILVVQRLVEQTKAPQPTAFCGNPSIQLE